MEFVPESRNVRATLKHRLELMRGELLKDKPGLRRKAGEYLHTGRFADSTHRDFVAQMLLLLAMRGPGAGDLTDGQWNALAGCVAFIALKDEEGKS